MSGWAWANGKQIGDIGRVLVKAGGHRSCTSPQSRHSALLYESPAWALTTAQTEQSPLQIGRRVEITPISRGLGEHRVWQPMNWRVGN
jgi:hypothetical protein